MSEELTFERDDRRPMTQHVPEGDLCLLIRDFPAALADCLNRCMNLDITAHGKQCRNQQRRNDRWIVGRWGYPPANTPALRRTLCRQYDTMPATILCKSLRTRTWHTPPGVPMAVAAFRGF